MTMRERYYMEQGFLYIWIWHSGGLNRNYYAKGRIVYIRAQLRKTVKTNHFVANLEKEITIIIIDQKSSEDSFKVF